MLLALKSPQEYFGKGAADTIHMLNVAASASQAGGVFFKPLKTMARNGWFADRCSVTMNSIEFDKNIEAISGHSDPSTLEGKNLILGVADEVDAFPSREMVRKGAGQPMNSVEDILDMLQTSSESRFPLTFKNIRMSFPRFKGSAIQRLTDKANRDIEKHGEASNHYMSGPLATWEVNPSKSKVYFMKAYEEDPVLAASKYECKPSLAINAYFSNQEVVKSSFSEEEQPITIERYKLVSGKYWMPVYSFSPDFTPIRGANYAMHGDLAVTSDRAGIAMSHVVRYEDIETAVVGENETVEMFLEQRPVVKVDFVIAFTSDKTTSPPRDIQIRWARQLAIDLLQKGFAIQLFSFDAFQSLDSMQILEDLYGIPAKRVSADISTLPYKTLNDLMNEGRVSIPKSDLALKELLGLNLNRSNGRIDHAPGASKDLSDAIACSAMGALELGGQENEDQERAYYADSHIESGSNVLPEMPYGFSDDMLGWGGNLDNDFRKWS